MQAGSATSASWSTGSRSVGRLLRPKLSLAEIRGMERKRKLIRGHLTEGEMLLGTKFTPL